MRWLSLSILVLAILVVGCSDDRGSRGGGDNLCVGDCQPEAGSAELSVGRPSGELVEGGSPVTSAIKLKFAPTADVTVSIVSLHPLLATIEPTEMVFTPQNFGATQLLTITPVDDTVDEPDETAEIEFTLGSEDTSFAGRPVNSLFVTVLDDDEAAGLLVDADGPLEVGEDGSAVTLEITLSTQPGGDVLVPVEVDDDTEASIDIDTLMFGELDWNIPQQVTVTGIDDMEADGDQVFNVVLGPSNSTGEIFNGLPAQNVEFTSIDGVCGNGVTDGQEDCEPTGNEPMTCDYGVQSCTWCDDNCTEQNGDTVGFCGDGNVQDDFEDCDGPTERCDYGEQSCTTCRDCETVAGQLTGFCGDGDVQSGEGEECDGSVCCSNDCQIDVGSCDLCLIFSEYVEGSGQDKALEIYNCDAGSVDLDGVALCLARNNDSACTEFRSLSGSIPVGGTYVVCNGGITAPGGTCDANFSDVTEFNGDDRLVLFLDLDGAQGIGSNDIILDAFGQTAVRPATTDEWESANYTRCNFTPYDGRSSFILSNYWTDTGVCDEFGCDYPDIFNGLGTPPNETCN